MNKTIDERINRLRQKQKELAEQEKRLIAQQKEKEKKARTHRLIEIGAEVESVLGKPIEKSDLPKLHAFLISQEERGHFFSRAMSSQAPDPEVVPERASYDMQHGGHSIIKG